MASRKLPRFLSPLEVAEMFKVSMTSGSQRDTMLLKSLYYLGLRNSEVRTLRIEDIDAINRTVKVVQGKGRKDRYVPIPGEFAEELKAFIANQEETCSRRSGLLFEGRNEKGELSDRHLRRIVKGYARMANIRKY